MLKIKDLIRIFKSSMKVKIITCTVAVGIIAVGSVVSYFVFQDDSTVKENPDIISLEEITGSKEKAEEIIKINETNDPSKSTNESGTTVQPKADETTTEVSKETSSNSTNESGTTVQPKADETTTEVLKEVPKETPQTVDNNYYSFSYDWNVGRRSGYVGGNNDYMSMYSQLSSKSTYAAFNSEVNKAVQVLTQGAYEETVKSKFLNKIYNGKTISNIEIKYYTVPFLENGEMVVDQYAYLQKQGVENFSSSTFATVIGDYTLASDNGDISRFVQVTVYFS